MEFKIRMLQLVIFFTMSLTCMTSCYKTNEYDSLSITFNNSRINSIFLMHYIDEIINKDLIIPKAIKEKFLLGEELSQQQRFIHFTNQPEEWYLIDFSAAPCFIDYIYNPTISPGIIAKRSILGEAQLKRIALRFQTQVLDKAVRYGKQSRLSDTIIYYKNTISR